MFLPIHYDEPVFRPPSEGRSLIIQLTLGCSWNKCHFCEMYTSKKFKIRDEAEIFDEIERVSAANPGVERVFLADGNAMVLKTERILSVLTKLKACFPSLRRVSAYAIPTDLERKSIKELVAMVSAGLGMVYIGLESGDDEVLKLMNKGETMGSSLRGCLKAKAADLKQSVMILNGLGGTRLSRVHACHSAELVNQIQPEYLSTLVLSFPFGLEHFKSRLPSEFEPLNTQGLIQEMGEFIGALELEKTVFRSDHASNYLVLKGQLNRDKEKLLTMIHRALQVPGSTKLRQEWQRGL